NLGAIDQRLEPARLERRIELIRKRHVRARIGDEDFSLRLGVSRAYSIRGHGNVPAFLAERLAGPESFGMMGGYVGSGSWIAVGTRVIITSRPPHRSVRAPFGHTAPTLGV